MDLLKVEPGLMIWTVVTFLVLLLLLKTFVWKPLLTALDEREERIRRSVEGAEQARQEAEQLLAQHKEQVANAEAEARDIIRQGRELAERTREELVQKTQYDSQRMIEQARRAIQQEKEVALTELREEIADLAIQAAEKIVVTNLDTELNRKLVDDFITRLPAEETSETS